MSVRALLCLLLACLPLLAFGCERSEPPAPGADALPRARVTIGVHVIDAEVADTPERKQRGLSGRKFLAEGQGMLFPYDAPGRQGFWMPDMYFDIDIVWMRSGRIVHVAPNVSRSDTTRIYQPSAPADLVLEVPAGTAARHGWRVGDAVSVAPASNR